MMDCTQLILCQPGSEEGKIMSQPAGGAAASLPAAAEPRLHPEGSSSSRKQERASSPARPGDIAVRQGARSLTGARAAAAGKQVVKGSRASCSRAGKQHPWQSAEGAVRSDGGAEHAASRAEAAAGDTSPGELEAQRKDPSDLSPARTEQGRVATPEQSGDGSPKNVKLKGKTSPKGGDGAQSSQAAGAAAGKSPKKQSSGGGYWKEGCLQSELMQFHLKKGLAAAGNTMSSKGNGGEAEQAGGQPRQQQAAAEASGAANELQDEVEKLREENECLKVRRELSVAAIVCRR